MRVVHILYSGLGGHGREFFSFVDADTLGQMESFAIFFGVERVRSEYLSECHRLGIPRTYVAKRPGQHAIPQAKVYQALCRYHPDVIVAHGGAAFPAIFAYALFHNTSVVFMETESNDLKLLVYRIETGIGLFAADGIVCLTDPYRAQLEHSNGALFDESRVHVIPNGIDERRTFVPANEERTAPQTPVRFGMQSRINAKKDHDTLLRAFATVVDIEGAPPVELSIAGDGDTRPQVERLIQQLGLEKSVSLEGLLDTTDLAAWLQGLDVYVHATHGESFCFSVMEALACGLPVIASRVPVLDRTLAAVKAVSLYPAGDVPVLADLMYDAIRDPEHWRARCVAAREYAVDALPASRMVERYMELFNSLPSGSPVSRSRRLAMRAIDLTVASLRARI